MLINIQWAEVKQIRPRSFQQCPATGQAVMGTNWKMEIPYKYEEELLYGKGDRALE